MAEQHLDNEEFFSKLRKLFDTRKGGSHGAIYLTQKRLSQSKTQGVATDDGSFSDIHPSQPLPVIVRAGNGKSKRERQDKMKLSTIVEPHDIEGFYLKYAEVCKAGMTDLKPRDRSKKKAKAKKKKAVA